MTYALVTAILYVLLGLAVGISLTVTCLNYPLFPFQLDNGQWTKNWLLMTVIDYYGSTLCLSVIVAYSEKANQAILWILAMNLLGTLFYCICFIILINYECINISFLSPPKLPLGSPFCCMYIVYRITYYQSIALMTTPSYRAVRLDDAGFSLFSRFSLSISRSDLCIFYLYLYSFPSLFTAEI